MKNIIFIISAVLVLGLQVAHSEEVYSNDGIYKSSCEIDANGNGNGIDHCPPRDITIPLVNISIYRTCTADSRINVVTSDGTCYDADSYHGDDQAAKRICYKVGSSEWYSCKKHRNYGAPINGDDEYAECNQLAFKEPGVRLLRGSDPCQQY